MRVTILLLALAVFLGACSNKPDTGPVGLTKPSKGEDVTTPGTEIATGPQATTPAGGYKIVPGDPGKFPSNAAGTGG